MKRLLRVVMVVTIVFAAFFPLGGRSSPAFSEDSPVKWRQQPDMRFGVNIASVEPLRLVADDWQCRDPRPVSDVHFWGSYPGWEANHQDPQTRPPGVSGFWIRIYADVPVSTPGVPYSRPGELLYQQEVREFTEAYMAPIVHPDGLFEHKFSYSLDLPEPFVQEEGTVYWLSVAAIMPAEAQYPWGWETSSEHWNDVAVTGNAGDWQPVGPVRGAILGFENLPLDHAYHVGDAFTTSDISVRVKEFQWSNLNWTDMGFARVENGGKAGGSGQELDLNNVNVSLELDRPLAGLSLRFGEYGGNVNLEVNGDFRNEFDFTNIGSPIGGVNLAVTFDPNTHLGTLELTGPIHQFAIGGQELWIDDIGLVFPADMAFELSVLNEPPPPLEPIKWQQRPDMVHGVNIASVAWPGEDAPSVADDWLCLDGSPVTDLHFWGSYLGWLDQASGPDFPTPGIEAFRIRIFSDRPATGLDGYSRPDRLLYETWVKDFQETYVDSIALPWEAYEHKFRYDLDLPRIFWQKRDRIYWLNIAAFPDPDGLGHLWGWESAMDRWNDFAVRGAMSGWDVVRHPFLEDPADPGTPGSRPLDMSFELTTCDGPIKWLQFPDMTDGFNIVTPNLIVPEDRLVAADDWLCTNGRPIAEVGFWGSYLSLDGTKHWAQETPGPPYGPLPEPPDVKAFTLRFHGDVPAGVDPDMPWSHPGELLQEAVVQGDQLMQRYWDSVPHPGPDGRIWWEHKFYYRVALNEPFRQQEGRIYWLDIGAETGNPEWAWGWETSKDHWNDNAVSGHDLIWKTLGRETSRFEDLPLYAQYHVGDFFETAGAMLAVAPFETMSGIVTNGYAKVVNNGLAGGSAQEMQVNNVNLAFELALPVTRIALLFGEYGGELNLKVNGDVRKFADFHDIDGQSIGGVHVDVVKGFGNDMGWIRLSGLIYEFVVGGQELWIDDVRYSRVDMAFMLMTEDDTPYCQGDFDRDGDVDRHDLAVFVRDFGRTDCHETGDCEGDFDYDGDVDGSNLAVFAAEFNRRDCPCGIPERSCCLPDGTCEEMRPDACVSEGGIPQGVGVSCESRPCMPPVEACCVPVGECVDVDADTCTGKLNGEPQGPGTDCANVMCVQPS